MTPYVEMFKRNYGIFAADEQEKIRQGHVLIVGCGGIGGTVGVLLARSGVEQFTLIDFDRYEPSNLNRQIGCFTSTLGRNKAAVIGEQILEINPQASVKVYDRYVPLSEIAELIPDADIVFPAADDFAFSLCVFRDARQADKPALMVVPAGTWASVSMIMPDSPTVESIHGIPNLPDYDSLKALFTSHRYKIGAFHYITHGCFRPGYYHGFMFEDLPPAQICPSVWTCSSIGALEVVKVLSGKWRPVASPKYWEITHKRIRVNRAGGLTLIGLSVYVKRILWFLMEKTPLVVFEKPFFRLLRFILGRFEK